MRFVLWRNRPMRELLKFRNLKESDCATVAERYRVLPPLPSPLFARRVAGLRCNCWAAQQQGRTMGPQLRHAQQYTGLRSPHVAFQRL
jgi:hypothetical protein